MIPQRNLWHLADGGHVDLAHVVEAVEQKWEFRGKKLGDVRDEFAAKEPRYRRLWGPRLSGQMVDLPEFNGVYRAVQRALRQAGLTGS